MSSLRHASPISHARRLRSMFVVASVLGGAASIFSVACADDEKNTESLVPEPDAAPDAPSAPDSSKDAGDSDARGPYDPADVPVACDGSPCATQLVAGSDHFCVRMSDGTVRCWGSDAWGVLGTTPEPDTGDPIPDAGSPDAASTVHAIADLSGVAQLSAAGATTCARLEDGSVKCWGDNRAAQLGLAVDPPVADYDPHPTPSVVPLASTAKRVDVGQGIACAVLGSGQLSCWGRNDQAQLARPSAPSDPSGPGLAQIEPLTLSRLAMSDYSMLGLSAEGEVWSWGALGGDFGTVAGRVGSVPSSATPKRLATLEKVTSLAASVWLHPYPDDPTFPPPPQPPPRAHACALANGEVYCWGRSYTGALGTGFPDKEQEPAHAPFPDKVKTWPQQLAVGDEITCARMTDGSVHCCGSDTKGRLGTGRMITLASSFTRADAFSHYAVQVATTDRAVCALVQDGTVECWGSNEKGELGRSRDSADHPSPVKVAF